MFIFNLVVNKSVKARIRLLRRETSPRANPQPAGVAILVPKRSAGWAVARPSASGEARGHSPDRRLERSNRNLPLVFRTCRVLLSARKFPEDSCSGPNMFLVLAINVYAQRVRN